MAAALVLDRFNEIIAMSGMCEAPGHFERLSHKKTAKYNVKK